MGPMPTPRPRARSAGEDEKRRFREVFAAWPSGVAVISAVGPRGPVGMTAASVCSLSLDPLLLIACLDNTARTLPVVRDSGRFAVNMLAAGQEELSRHFASKGDDQFRDVAHELRDGLPILAGVAAWLACDVHDLLPGGDHTIGVGRVTAMAHDPRREPLVWHRGVYREMLRG
jgi:3-hydroxy-9,10-secoandrosta-1,3,5(10)-triene-9,17-dione monooxygenase reductase component